MPVYLVLFVFVFIAMQTKLHRCLLSISHTQDPFQAIKKDASDLQPTAQLGLQAERPKEQAFLASGHLPLGLSLVITELHGLRGMRPG